MGYQDDGLKSNQAGNISYWVDDIKYKSEVSIEGY